MGREFGVTKALHAQVRDLTGTGDITKRRIKEGVGEFPVDCPLEDCTVRVHYTARLAGTDQVISLPAHAMQLRTCTEVVVTSRCPPLHQTGQSGCLCRLYCCQNDSATPLGLAMEHQPWLCHGTERA